MTLHQQVRQALSERIARGDWQPGDQLPTIRDLCKAYAVSRITIVQALAALAREGLITSHQGKGSFVAEPRVEHGPVQLTSFTEETVRRGNKPESRLLSLRREPATAALANELGIEPGGCVVRVERLRLADGDVMGIQTAFLPDHIFPALADTQGGIQSLYRLLQERYGVVPSDATDSYLPIAIGKDLAPLLGVEVGAPAFTVHRVTHDQFGRVIEVVDSVLRGDRYRVVLYLKKTGLS